MSDMNAQSTIHLSPKQQATLKWIIRACPPDVYAANTLRREMNRMTPIKLARHLAALLHRNLETLANSLRHTLRALTRRWQHLDSETKQLRASIKMLVARIAPQLLEQVSIGVDTAAEILMAAGDNLERIHSEAAFARLAGINPVPAGFGMI